MATKKSTATRKKGAADIPSADRGRQAIAALAEGRSMDEVAADLGIDQKALTQDIRVAVAGPSVLEEDRIRAQVAALAKRKLDSIKIAAKLGVSQDKVREIAREDGIELVRVGNRGRTSEEIMERRSAVVAAFRTGSRPAQIAQRLQISPETVYADLNSSGIRVRAERTRGDASPVARGGEHLSAVDRLERIATMAVEGKRPREIAEAIGTNTAYVEAAAERAGIWLGTSLGFLAVDSDLRESVIAASHAGASPQKIAKEFRLATSAVQSLLRRLE